mgnify:CR=1 FL=1
MPLIAVNILETPYCGSIDRLAHFNNPLVGLLARKNLFFAAGVTLP